ncbi:MAG: hypothetical protein ACRDOK_18800 [Streptosporangiaceae bacterium]
MGEFRIGRKFASHSYPDARRDTTQPFARNYALGPTTSTDVTMAGTLVPWTVIESGAPPGTDVPITPKTSGIIQADGVICIKNSSATPQNVQLLVLVNSVAITPENEAVTIAADPGYMAIPFIAEDPNLRPIGTPVNVTIKLTANADGVITMALLSSSLRVQEVPPATG